MENQQYSAVELIQLHEVTCSNCTLEHDKKQATKCFQGFTMTEAESYGMPIYS
jgi:hypothetical protein